MKTYKTKCQNNTKLNGNWFNYNNNIKEVYLKLEYYKIKQGYYQYFQSIGNDKRTFIEGEQLKYIVTIRRNIAFFILNNDGEKYNEI